MKQMKKEHLFIVIMTGFFLLAGGICFSMYMVTEYPLYFSISVGSVLCGASNLILLLLKISFWASWSRKRDALRKSARIICYAGYGGLIVFGSHAIVKDLQQMETVVYPAVSNVVVFLILFAGAQVFYKLCGYVKGNTTFERAIIRNSKSFMRLMILESLLSAVCTLIEAKRLFGVQKYLGWFFAILLFYYVGCILLSMVVNAIRKAFINEPYFHIPFPTFKKVVDESEKTVGFIEYLETNTGISMRSLWSVKFIRQIAPLIVILSGLFLWLSTCIVQVESYQKAAVYRLGVLQEDLLGSGIHLTLPYPFDKVEIFDTGCISKTTIGFRAETSADNLWTSSHQGEEYKLLLGSSDEVVSINLRLEYKISDLFRYLESSAEPEAILQALAYELVTDMTIHTDLNTLLSTDREVFSRTFIRELTKMLQEKDIGLEVVSVILESIHPPKEISEVYQKTISAEIDAKSRVLEAEAMATSALAKAKMSYDESINLANSDSVQSVAGAKANVAEFMASVEANQTYGEKYTYQKYLNAFREAYGKANLVIVSEGIDQSAIYFGSFSSGNDSSDDRVLGDGNEKDAKE